VARVAAMQVVSRVVVITEVEAMAAV